MILSRTDEAPDFLQNVFTGKCKPKQSGKRDLKLTEVLGYPGKKFWTYSRHL